MLQLVNRIEPKSSQNGGNIKKRGGGGGGGGEEEEEGRGGVGLHEPMHTLILSGLCISVCVLSCSLEMILWVYACGVHSKQHVETVVQWLLTQESEKTKEVRNVNLSVKNAQFFFLL